MNTLTSLAALVAALVAATTLTGLSETAWSDETTPFGSQSESTWSGDTTLFDSQSESVSSSATKATKSAAPAEQTPAPASSVAPGRYTPPIPGGYAQIWPQPRYWRAPQQIYGHVPPRYPPGGQYPAYPAAPARAPAARVNPLIAELKQIQEQLTAKSRELDEARSTLEELQGNLQDSLAAEATLSEKIAYSTREQNDLRMRVTELVNTLKTASVTMEQQHQLINNQQANNQNLAAERDRLHSELASRNEQLATLQSELQAATQGLAQARTRAHSASEALNAAMLQIGTHRDELTKLEAELQQLESRLQSDWKSMGQTD